jgi:hypothetical protein
VPAYSGVLRLGKSLEEVFLLGKFLTRLVWNVTETTTNAVNNCRLSGGQYDAGIEFRVMLLVKESRRFQSGDSASER